MFCSRCAVKRRLFADSFEAERLAPLIDARENRPPSTSTPVNKTARFSRLHYVRRWINTLSSDPPADVVIAPHPDIFPTSDLPFSLTAEPEFSLPRQEVANPPQTTSRVNTTVLCPCWNSCSLHAECAPLRGRKRQASAASPL